MNLIADSWIPVIDADGAQRLLSLRELFAIANNLRDLAVKPHEKIALLRLLICIAQAALDGPDDFDAWEECHDEIAPKTKTYLEKWQHAFELFGDGTRFLQVPGLKPGKADAEGNPATKLDLTLASGNNASIFDNAAGLARSVMPPRLALTLLTFQCFSPCGTIGVANWNGVDTPGAGKSKHAPCTASSALHTFLQGENLRETIHLNLMNKEGIADLPGGGWGRPVWEVPVANTSDQTAIKNATLTYLGRLVPLSRAVRLDSNGVAVILANALDYPLSQIFRDPTATVVMRKEGPGVLGVSLGRSVWRNLSAITVKLKAGDGVSGPVALNNLADDRGATLWIGALAAAGNGKIIDVVEAVYEVPAGMFRDEGRKLFEEGIALADSWQDALWKSIKSYAATLKLEPPPYDRGRQYFWTRVEQQVPELLALAGAPKTAGDLKESLWGKAAKEAARDAYAFACAHQSPRQIEAFAIGRQQLFLPKPKDPSASNQKSTRKKQTA